MGTFRTRTLDARYLELRELAEHAQANPQPNLWPRVQEAGWQLLKDCVTRMATDSRAAIVAHATAKITLTCEAGAENWHRVMAIGWAMSSAVSVLDAMSGPEFDRDFMAALAEDLFRRAEVVSYAAHRAKTPAVAGALAEQLTSIRLGERTLWRSLTGLAARPHADQEHVLRTTRRRLREIQQPPTGGLSFSGRPDQMNAWFEDEIRKNFRDIDRNRSGARVAMSYGVGLPLEAMRMTGRSLLYIGGGLREGVAILFDAAALDDPARPLATSIGLPGYDLSAVGEKVAELHKAAADRRARMVLGTVLTLRIEQLLTSLGESVWRPILGEWPQIRESPVALIPLGESGQLPLYTAMVDGRPACSVLNLTVAPSARSLVLAGEYKPTPGPAFIAADPSSGDEELYYVVDEAKAVAAIYGIAPIVIRDSSAAPPLEERMRTTSSRPHGESSSAQLVARLRGSAIIHLACHGVIEPKAPLHSAILLGGALTLETMLAEDLRPGCLIVLSACDLAGIGTDLPGEQLGFPAALLAGGARSVIAALWPVPDAPPTVRLMQHFHEGLTMASTSEALGAALGHAFDSGAPASLWAPFTCFGA